jgi:hypothetical protein
MRIQLLASFCFQSHSGFERTNFLIFWKWVPGLIFTDKLAVRQNFRDLSYPQSHQRGTRCGAVHPPFRLRIPLVSRHRSLVTALVRGVTLFVPPVGNFTPPVFPSSSLAL